MRPHSLAATLLLLAITTNAAAEGPQPGLWRVTVQTETDGRPLPPRVSTRCLRPEQLQNIEKTFVPEQGANCERIEFEWTGQKLSWRIQCTAPVRMDNAGRYVFDGPRRYSGSIVVRALLPSGELISRTTLDGEHIGECPPESR